jgi:hypothetical protein
LLVAYLLAVKRQYKSRAKEEEERKKQTNKSQDNGDERSSL